MLRETEDRATLAGFVDRWVRDQRPWAREQIVEYLQLSMCVAGHEVVVKRLFRHAEAARDDDLMAWFLPAFDRLVRYRRRRRKVWDGERHREIFQEYFVLPRNRERGALFTYHTRYYLRRRAWRYLRHMAFRRPQAYAPAVATALARYTDADLSRGEHVLESWGLMHACFGEHSAVTYNATRFTVRAGHTLAELSPAPCFPELWDTDDALDAVLGMIAVAQSRLVRLWGMQLVEERHTTFLDGLDVGEMAPLLHHADGEVQQFAIRCMSRIRSTSALPIANWRDALANDGRDMRYALNEIRETLIAQPGLSSLLLPWLAAAVTTERGPEQRAGLAALTAVVVHHPQIGEQAMSLVPELQIE